MAYLDDEFDKLVEGMKQAIQSKVDCGILTAHEAEQLREMITQRVTKSDSAPAEDWEESEEWDNSGCSWNTSGCSF